MIRSKAILSIILFFQVLFADDYANSFTLNVFFTNDVHGGIIEQKAEFLNPDFPPMLGGGASAYAIMKQVKKTKKDHNENWLTIDAGDIFQGTLVGTLSKGEAIVKYMNMAEYDACVPGNHDFDLGKENLEKLISQSEFAWVCSNIIDKKTGKIWHALQEYTIKIVNGIKIGITGATTVGTERMSFPENIEGLEFIPEIPALQQTVNSLQKTEKVDLVVALVHSGLPYDRHEGFLELKETTYEDVISRGYANAMEIAHFVKGIDILLGGHLHRGYQEPWEDPVNHTICLQNYGNGGNLGWIQIEVDRETGNILGYDYPSDRGSLLLLQEDEFWPDSMIAAYIHSQRQIYEKGFKEVIGNTRAALTRSGFGEAPMYNLVTDAMRERVDADFAFTNYGGIRADLNSGSITREDIFRVLPFGNQIVEFQANGNFVKKIIEEKIKGNRRGMAISGANIVYNPILPDGSRVTKILIEGQPLQANQMYRIATTDYLMEGNSGLEILTRVAKEMTAFSGIYLRDAVINYVKENSPLEVGLEGRWEKNENAQADPEWIKQFSTDISMSR